MLTNRMFSDNEAIWLYLWKCWQSISPFKYLAFFLENVQKMPNIETCAQPIAKWSTITNASKYAFKNIEWHCDFITHESQPKNRPPFVYISSKWIKPKYWFWPSSSCRWTKLLKVSATRKWPTSTRQSKSSLEPFINTSKYTIPWLEPWVQVCAS